jgi:deazaflavin-dependent oxidoreductase (nitroreductase family)
MKVPELLFVIINPIMRFLLRSPLHVFWSKSLMLITFTGRKSGRTFTTPVRYVSSGAKVYAFTAKENQWWRNLRGGADVVLRTRGQDAKYHAVAIDEDQAIIRQWLIKYLALFPQDAVYHNIRLNKDKSLNEDDLARAVPEAVVVEATPVS